VFPLFYLTPVNSNAPVTKEFNEYFHNETQSNILRKELSKLQGELNNSLSLEANKNKLKPTENPLSSK
jgi:cell shape-determining protein MreC